MFFKTDAERAAAQAVQARKDAGEVGASAASGARNLGAAVLATLAEVTAPEDDKSGKRHAKRAKAKALRAATKDRETAAKAAAKAREHGMRAAGHSRKDLDRRTEDAGGKVAALAGLAGGKAGEVTHRASARASEVTHKAATQAKGATHLAAEGARMQSAHAAEVLRESAELLRDKASPLGERAGETAGAGAALLAALAASARERATETRDRAVAGVDHGIDVAVPRAQDSVAAVGPRVDQLRDLINDELLPKIQAMLNDVQTSKDRTLSSDDKAVAKVTGKPKRRKKKGGALITFGLLAAVGAGITWWLSQQQKAPATDPWANPAEADPWASTVATDAPELVDSADPLGSGTVDTGVTAGAATGPVGTSGMATAVDTDTTETTVVATGATGSTGTSTTGDVEARMLDSEEIDELATEEPPTIDEQGSGETPTEEIEAARSREGGPMTETSGSTGDTDGQRA